MYAASQHGRCLSMLRSCLKTAHPDTPHARLGSERLLVSRFGSYKTSTHMYILIWKVRHTYIQRRLTGRETDATEYNLSRGVGRRDRAADVGGAAPSAARAAARQSVRVERTLWRGDKRREHVGRRRAAARIGGARGGERRRYTQRAPPGHRAADTRCVSASSHRRARSTSSAAATRSTERATHGESKSATAM
jgi:hypothetical protein